MDLLFSKLKISKKEFLFQYHSHPNSPSILAFSDTLNFLNVKNIAYEVEKEDWNELPKEFITIYESQFVIVEEQNENYLIFNDKKEIIGKEKFLEQTGKLVILYEKTEEVKEKGNINFKFIMYSFFIITLFYSAFNHKLQLFFYNLFSIFGVLISLELFNNKFGKTSIVINAICNNSAQSSDKQSSCDKIFNSDNINFFGLKLSDFSLVYFLGLFFLGFSNPDSVVFLKLISYSSILVIGYSLFIQFFIEKTFCKICLIIISILIGQIIISNLYFDNQFSYSLLLISIFSFLAIFFYIIYLNKILIEKQKYYELSLNNIKFKKNYDIFKRELQENKLDFKHQNKVFWFKKNKAKLHISLITNPFCGYCKEAHAILKNIFYNYQDISIQIRFNYFNDVADENFTSLLTAFKNIYDIEGEEFLLKVMETWFENYDLKKFKKNHENFLKPTDLSGIEVLANENRDNNLTFTPIIFINNYQFPDKYEINDIFYFLDELLEDEIF